MPLAEPRSKELPAHLSKLECLGKALLGRHPLKGAKVDIVVGAPLWVHAGPIQDAISMRAPKSTRGAGAGLAPLALRSRWGAYYSPGTG